MDTSHSSRKPLSLHAQSQAMQASPSHSAASVPDKVSSPDSRCVDIVANYRKVITNDAVAADVQEQSNMQETQKRFVTS